jgi:hypothetical protein
LQSSEGRKSTGSWPCGKYIREITHASNAWITHWEKKR